MRPIELDVRKLSPSHLVALGGVVALCVAAWLALQARHTAPAIAPPATSATSSPQGGFFVHVAGAVKRPGLYELPSGSRVADAVAAAGGARPGADLDALNLAQPVADGMRIEVPSRVAPSSAAPASPTSPGLVSVNSADITALETVPGIGPVKAAAIVAYREQAGGFATLEQLMEVSGIGPATFEMIAPYLTL